MSIVQKMVKAKLAQWSVEAMIFCARHGKAGGAFITEKTIIQSGVFIGPGVVTTADNEMRVRKDYVPNPPIICAGARIGANATILPGIVIGENALVGAGALVTQDVPSGAVALSKGSKAIILQTTESVQAEFKRRQQIGARFVTFEETKAALDIE